MRHQFDLEESHIQRQIAESTFALVVWCRFNINVLLFSFLEIRETHITCCTCLLLYSDHADIALAVTERRLQIRGLIDWEVPTPPVQLGN